MGSPAKLSPEQKSIEELKSMNEEQLQVYLYEQLQAQYGITKEQALKVEEINTRIMQNPDIATIFDAIDLVKAENLSNGEYALSVAALHSKLSKASIHIRFLENIITNGTEKHMAAEAVIESANELIKAKDAQIQLYESMLTAAGIDVHERAKAEVAKEAEEEAQENKE